MVSLAEDLKLALDLLLGVGLLVPQPARLELDLLRRLRRCPTPSG
jgi:hypothetical protein